MTWRAIATCSRDLRHRVEASDLPPDVLGEISAAHASLCGNSGVRAVAVRSSATTEDASDASFAGLQDTYLWVTSTSDGAAEGAQLLGEPLFGGIDQLPPQKAGSRSRASRWRSSYRRMVDARTAGVLFTRSPITGDRSVVTIEGAWGLGSAVVGGEVTPDRWVIGKITGEISVREISDKMIQHVPAPAGGIDTVPVAGELRQAACMSDEELQSLRAVARAIERHYGCAQDIEWAVDRLNGEILILQSRPETVWSAKETAPTARAAENPLTHVLSIFGGRR